MQKPIFLFYKLQGLDLECAYVEGELTVCYGKLSYNILFKVCFVYCPYVFGDGDSKEMTGFLKLVVSKERYHDINGIFSYFVDRVKEVTNPNHIEIEHNLALIAVVGRGMKATKGTATRIFAALSHADINIKMIDQGSSELNIIIGIHEVDFEKAIKVIYDMFILSEAEE